MKRLLKVILATILISISAIMLYILVAFPVIRATWESSTRKESVRILEAVHPTNGRADDVSLFLTFPDNSWMAFQYRDLHCCGVLSLAIVRDSGGQWFESSHHFCSMFAGYRKDYEMLRLLRESGDPEAAAFSSGYKDIHAVAISQGLQAAREQLLKIGFIPMKR